MSDKPDWVIAWIENYNGGDRVEPRWCADLEEAVELAMDWEESDDHHVAAIETPDGELANDLEREIRKRIHERRVAEYNLRRGNRPPTTHHVYARIPDPIPQLPEDWRNWGPVASCSSEEEARQRAAKWIAAIGEERVQVRPTMIRGA